MKKTTMRIFITLSLVLSVLAFTTCKRDAIEEPSPTGPSSFAILLNLSANPNVLLAGLSTRQMTTITANLQKYNGAPLAGQTIYFEVVDKDGAKLNVGYFEGNLSLQAKSTDGSGTATVNYYGPLSDEIAGNGGLYIKASVGEGSQIIFETVPLYIIRSDDQITFIVQAIPDVLYAGATPPTAEIRATALVGGVPVTDYPVYFMIQDATKIGTFADGSVSTFAMTNGNGVASVTYVGPTYPGVPGASVTVTIRAQLTQDTYEDVKIEVIRFQ